MKKKFEGRWSEYSCLWARAILPHGLGKVLRTEITEATAVIKKVGTFGNTLVAGGALYTDGAG